MKADLGMFMMISRLKKHFSISCSSSICNFTKRQSSYDISVNFRTYNLLYSFFTICLRDYMTLFILPFDQKSISLSFKIFKKVRNSLLDKVYIRLLITQLTLMNFSFQYSFFFCIPSKNLIRQCQFIEYRSSQTNLFSSFQRIYCDEKPVLQSAQQKKATCLGLRYCRCFWTYASRHYQTSLSPFPSLPQLHMMSSNCSRVANLLILKVDVLSMLKSAFYLNLKKYPDVDFRRATNSVILSLSFEGQVLQMASSNFN